MGSLLSRLAEKATSEEKSSRDGRRRRHRSRSEKRGKHGAQETALDMLILAATELIKIEIENARARRAHAGHHRHINPYPGVKGEGSPYGHVMGTDGR